MRSGIFLLVYLMSFFLPGLQGQEINPFNKLKFDKVIFYDFEGKGDKGLVIIDQQGNYLQKIAKQVLLDKSTLTVFNKKLVDKNSYGAGTASCFDPHCGLVYFKR
jgi:hypothetical protein